MRSQRFPSCFNAPGTVIRNNLIHDISPFTCGGWGICPDEGSTGMLIENNVVCRCKSAGFHQHYGRENIVRNNIFALNRENRLMRTRAEPHLSFTLTGDIVYFDQGRLLGSDWTGEGFKMKRNLYFDARSRDARFAGRSFAKWQPGGGPGLGRGRSAVRESGEVRPPSPPRLAGGPDRVQGG